MSDTPETDAKIKELDAKPLGTTEADDIEKLKKFAARLERERNEARANSWTRLGYGNLIAERDQLRKVADEAKIALRDFKVAVAFVKEMTPQGPNAFVDPIKQAEAFDKSYNSLPHVIERNKAS